MAQVIIGFSADESQGLLNDDLSFYGTAGSETEDSSSESDEASEATVLLPENLPSDAEEKLDLSAQDLSASATTGPNAATKGRASGRCKKRALETLSTIDEVAARTDAGCSCTGVNCFLQSSPDSLLKAVNLSEALSHQECQLVPCWKA